MNLSDRTEEKKKSKFEFEKIDISFIYGFVNYNLKKSERPPEKSNYSEMWAPIYNLNSSSQTDGFCIQILEDIKDKPIKIISENNPKGIKATISAHILRKKYDPKNLKEVDGGPGSLTIKISVQPQEGLSTNSIFDILNLVPRISISPKLSTIEGLEIEGLDNFNRIKISDKISKSNYSSIFKLFCYLLYSNQECWSELYEPHIECSEKRKECQKKCQKFYPFYDIDSAVDPQIPYMLVEGFLQKDFYKTVFIDNNNKSQKEYTHEIGSLVGRWLNIENKNHVNIDYYSYYEDVDAIIKKDEKVFISRFRDKKTFVVLSSLLTLILKCKHSNNGKEKENDADKAVEYTTNAVLSYLEFSRTRLHNALWLNKQLDKIINDVDGKEETSEILPIKITLNTLKGKVAKSMNNPISYMWDSVLGQEIPSLKINRNVEKLEKDTIRKLNLINELISDKIQNSRISYFVDANDNK
jgi:hypothetical protein